MYELVIVLMVLMVLFTVRMNSKCWLNPAFIMILFWSFFIIVSIIAFKNTYEWNYMGLVWIIGACICFAVGNLFGSVIEKLSAKKNLITQREDNDVALSKFSWNFILLCIIIGLFHVAIEVKMNGFSFKMFFDLDSLINMNTEMAYQRYNGGENSGSFILHSMIVFIYVAPLCGGYAYVFVKKKFENLICYGTFIPIIVSLLFTNGKVGILASVFLWISGYIVGYVWKYNKAPTIKLQRILVIGCIILVIFALLYISMLLRIGDLSSNTMQVVNKKFFIYALGHMPAFDYWFKTSTFTVDYSLGKNTFIGIFNALGIVSRKQGMYSDVVFIYDGQYTNVFTAFRGIIQDYGQVGGLLFFMGFGILAGCFFQYTLNEVKKGIIARVALAMTYFFTFYSFIVSAWSYSSYILVFFVFAFYLRISTYNINVSINENTFY